MNAQSISYHKLLEGMGKFGHGRNYQTLTLVCFFTLKLLSGYLWIYPYFLLEPEIVNCHEKFPMSHSNQTFACNFREVCLYNNKHKDNEMLYNFKEKLNHEYSFLTYFDIYCDSFKISLLGSTMSIGHCIAIMMIPFLTEKFGYLNTIYINLFFDLAVRLIMIFVKEFYTFTILLTLGTFGGQIYFAVPTYYLMEIAEPKHRGIINMISHSFCPLAGIIFAISFHITKSWISLQIIFSIIIMISIPLLYFFISESPIFLHRSNQYDKMHESLQNIAKINNKEDLYLQWRNALVHDEGQVENNKKQVSLKESVQLIFSYPAEILNFSIFMLIHFTTWIGMLYICLDLNANPDMLWTPIIFFSLDCLIYIFYGILMDAKIVGRKIVSLIFTLVVMTGLTVKYILIMKYNESSVFSVLEYIVRFSVDVSTQAYQIYTIESYSLDVMIFATSINRLFGRLGGIIIPFLYNNRRSESTITLAVLYGLTFIGVFFLKETKDSKIYETIHEKNEDHFEENQLKQLNEDEFEAYIDEDDSTTNSLKLKV
jgi:hypothetical protein